MSKFTVLDEDALFELYQDWVRAQESVTSLQNVERDMAQAGADFKKVSADLAADEEAAQRAYTKFRNGQRP